MRYSVQISLAVMMMILPLTGFSSFSIKQQDPVQEEETQPDDGPGQQKAAVEPDSKQEPQELSDMELIERVEILQRELESPSIPKRDAAQKELIRLGVRVLDYLESTTEKTPTDAVQRTNQVRAALEKIVVASVTKASMVTLNGKMTVGSALEEIRKQTNNDVGLPGETPDIFLNREIEMNVEKVSFWEALADVMKQGELVVDPYGGARGQLRLTPTQSARIKAANPGIELPDENKQESDAPRNVSGIFNLTVTQVNASRNLANPALNYCNIHMVVRWEPRVTPISIELPSATIKAIDEFDNPIEITNKDEVISGTVQPEISELEFSVPIALVDRQIEVIKSFDATIDAVVTGRTETFRFRKLGKLAPGTEQTKAGATVTFDGIRKNEDLFGITVRLSFDEEHNALESHQNWVYGNQIYLENEAGEKFESLAYEGVKQTNNEVAIRYYFEPDPKNMTLYYKTPAAIVQIPVKVSLKNIPLP
jgi:hypothetical protein